MTHIEEKLYIVSLVDVYANMLTKKQLSIIKSYYELDYSLAEIAEEENISRQAVHDSILRTKETLFDLEDKLGIYKKSSRVITELNNLKTNLDSDAVKNIDRIIKLI